MRTAKMLPALVIGILLAVGCDAPPIDDFRRNGGASPDPTGVMEGTILYVGPRPTCVTNPDTMQLDIVGRVILTLFEFDNPPPPSGQAASASNLLTVPGQALFGIEDCLPAEPTAEDLAFITRSVDWTWPEIELGHESENADYQIRGFYDYDADFIPFFGVVRLPTAGDVAGGAFEDVSAPILMNARISFGGQDDNPNGQVVSGITVSLGAPVNTELPVFSMTSDPLSSEATNPIDPNPVVAEGQLAALTGSTDTGTTLHMYSRDPSDDPESRDSLIRDAIASSPMEIDFDNERAYAWYVRDVDANSDGIPDLHPILGETNGIIWQTPITILQRARSELEVAGGVPSVLLLPTVRPTQTMFKKVHYPSINVVMAPVAAVQTHPTDAACRIPYITPGNGTAFFERIPVECQELPTGRYAVNVLQGMAGGLPLGGGTRPCDAMATPTGCLTGEQCTGDVCVVPSVLSDTEVDVLGGSFSSQAWSLPNELGSEAQIDAPFAAEQGIDAMFLVVDPNPDGPVGRLDGREGCSEAVDLDTMETRTINFVDFPTPEAQTHCCAPVAHLCGVPLCEAVEIMDPRSSEMVSIRPGPTSVDEAGVPDCVPFLMPGLCCPDDVI